MHLLVKSPATPRHALRVPDSLGALNRSSSLLWVVHPIALASTLPAPARLGAMPTPGVWMVVEGWGQAMGLGGWVRPTDNWPDPLTKKKPDLA